MSIFKNVKKIWLASGSPRRKQLAADFGLPFEVIKTDAEERYSASEPEAIAREIAVSKAESALKILKPGPGEVILAADTSVWVDGIMYGKPVDRADAKRMLNIISGRTHSVITAAALAYTAGEGGTLAIESRSVRTEVTIAPMTDEETEAYIATGDPMDKAGAYGIQGAFSVHVSSIDGDFYNVMGLPVAAVYEMLKKADGEILRG